MPAHLEQGRIFSCLENAMRLSDYKYVVEPGSYKIIVHIDEEQVEIALFVREAENEETTIGGH